MQSACTDRGSKAGTAGFNIFSSRMAILCIRNSNIFLRIQSDILANHLTAFDIDIILGYFDRHVSCSTDVASCRLFGFAMAFCLAMAASDTCMESECILSPKLIISDPICFFPVFSFRKEVRFFSCFGIDSVNYILLILVGFSNLTRFLSCFDGI